MYRYIIFHKPYDVLSQFTREIPSHRTLADYLKVDKDVYPIGRLDRDSEGLLLLSNDPSMNHRILDPKNKMPKTYICQVDGEITEDAIGRLSTGVDIKLKSGIHRTQPAKVRKMEGFDIAPRNPPIRVRKHIPTSWIEITITEGKNRQIRKMCAAVGYPVLRLIRIRIGQLELGQLKPGEWTDTDGFNFIN